MPNLIYDKYAITNSMLKPQVKALLDVGCRDTVLRNYLHNGIEYSGMDLFAAPDVAYVGNAEDGLPFSDNHFDAVVALDLLEHTDNIWFVFDEFLRVARKQVIVLLPNAYHWAFRLRYLVGAEMGKYYLPPEPILDRHRWLLSYRGAKQLCSVRSKKAGWRVTQEVVLHGGRRHLPIDLALSPLSKNLAAWAVMFCFEPIALNE